MADCTLSPREFIQNTFAPRLACLCSEDADRICTKNGLNFIALISPFCRAINAEMIVSDLTNRRFYLKNMSLFIGTIQQAVSPSPVIARNIFHDRVSQAVAQYGTLGNTVPTLTIPTKETSLNLSATAPWYESFRAEYMRLFPFCDYECIRDFLGCLFVMSSSSEDAVSRAKQLIEQQVQQQSNQKYPRWFGPNIVKFFIVLHDLSVETDESKACADKAMQYFSSTYGDSHCYLLAVNSQSQKPEIDPWMPYRLDDQDQNTNAPEDCAIVNHDLPASHPLDLNIQSQDTDGKRTYKTEFGLLLGQEDADRIKDCVVSIIVKCLIPYAERQIRILNELIISKKGIHRTLVNATKKIFGPSGPSTRPSQRQTGNGGGSQVVYAGEAIELQNRKAGDLSFMFQLYDQALAFFQSARRDYSADQAWNYYAAASEMCGLSALLSSTAGFSTSNAKAFPMQYLEGAIKSYSDVNKTSPQSIRAVIFATEICKALHLHQEAANFFKSRTPDDFDLLYGLFLEQAGHCYLRLSPPANPGRFAFSMVLAGFRYFKATQRKLGILVYKEALKVFDSRHWLVAEDHIRLNIVRQCIALKAFAEALSHFTFLFTGPQRQVPAQQVLMLKDFMTCHRLVHGESAIVDELKIPLIMAQEIRTTIGRSSDVNDHAVEVLDDSWLTLEEKTLHTKKHTFSVFKPQRYIFSHLTDNRVRPMAAVGETVTVEVPVRNPFGIILRLRSLDLLHEFHPKSGHAKIEKPGHGVAITCDPPELILGPSENRRLIFSLIMSQPGALTLSGLSYVLSLQTDPSTENDLNHQISFHQTFRIEGVRLNNSKVEKMSVHHAVDHRLDITVLPGRSSLTGKWENLPGGLLSGQVVRLSLVLENGGQRPASGISVAASLPDVLVFFNASKEENVVTLAIPDGIIEPGKKVTVTAVFIAPFVPGNYSLQTLIYYESALSPEDSGESSARKAPGSHHPHHHQRPYHIWRMQHDFKVLPGLTLQGFVVPSVTDRGQAVINLKISHINQVQLHGIPMQLIEILSLCDRWHIDKLMEIQGGDDGSVLPNEEYFVNLLASQIDSQLGRSKDELSSFAVPSHLDAGDDNFRKAARSLSAAGVWSGQTNILTLRLLWKVSLTSDGKPTNVYGIRFITFPSYAPSQNRPVQQLCFLPKHETSVPDSMDLDSGLLDDPLSLAFLHLPSKDEQTDNFDVIDWRVELPSEEVILPDHGGITVPVTVEMACGSSVVDAVISVTVELRTAVKSFPVGCRKQMTVLRPMDVTRLTFHYCFTAAGTYNMAELVYVKAICGAIPELKVAKFQKPSASQAQMLLRVL